MRYLSALLLCALALPRAQAAGHSIEVLHWWTAGGEAKAANVLKQRWQAQGNRWVDAAIDGGGGGSAMLVLRSRTLAGHPPQAAHLKGVELHEWARLGFLRPVSDLARRGQWDMRLYPFVSSTLNHQGQMIAVPVGIHRINWLWLNQPIFDRHKLTPPRTWSELLLVASKLKAAGITPLAMGDDPWQLAILFESIALGEGGSDFYRRAFVNLEPKVLTGEQMQQVLRRFHSLRTFLPANHVGLKWNQATQMLIDGQAAMQLMGDWTKGELIAAGEIPGQRIRCLPAPGTAGRFSYNLDSLALFRQPQSRQDQAQQRLAELLMTPEFQRDFNRLKGSIPVLADMELNGFDRCGKDAAQALQRAQRDGSLVPSVAEGMATPPRVQQALQEVLANYFADANGDAAETAQRLAQAIRAVQAEWQPGAEH